MAQQDLIQLLHGPLHDVSLPVLQLASKEDPLLCTLHSYIIESWPARVVDELIPFSRVKDELSCWNDFCVIRGRRTVMPSVLREQVLNIAYEGHLGVVKVKHCCRDLVWWPGIDHEIGKRLYSLFD